MSLCRLAGRVVGHRPNRADPAARLCLYLSCSFTPSVPAPPTYYVALNPFHCVSFSPSCTYNSVPSNGAFPAETTGQ